MSDREQAVELLLVAERELRALRGMRDAETFADEVFGFLAQQAVEKALKAWLCALGVTYPFTHDLTDLLSRLEDGGQDMADLYDLANLNPFAVELRYSSSSFEDYALDRPATIKQVEMLVEKVTLFVAHTESDP